MKKIMLICFALVMGAGMCIASPKGAQPQKKSVTTVFSTDIECDHCVKKIMDNAASLGKGVKDVQVNVAKKEVTVTYDASKNSDANIIKALSSLKVKAQVKGSKVCACGKHEGKSCEGKCEKHDAKACDGTCKGETGKSCCNGKR